MSKVLDFRDRLRQELARRRRVNRRYSLRAFAKYLGADHATLSQILRGRRPLPADCLHRWATRIELGAEQIALYAAAEGADDPAAFAQRQRQMQWMGEAAALLTRPEHWQLLRLLHDAEWRPDMRWAASRLGVSIDDLNDAWSRLLRLGLASTAADGSWRDLCGADRVEAPQLLERALARLRDAMSAG